MKRFMKMLPVLALFCIAAMPAGAQVNSNTQTVALNLTSAEFLNLSCTPAAVNMIEEGGGSASIASYDGDNPIVCVTQYNLAATRTSLNVYFYDGDGAFLTGSKGYQIPDSSWTGTLNGSDANPLTTPLGMGWTSLHGAVNGVGSVTDTLALKLSNLAIPADTYSGTIVIQAVAN